MKLVRLDIQVMPGIEPGFVLENIEPGINMVTGPNAAGKSSLVRALGYLVGEPRSDDPVALSLAAVFESDNGRWTVRRTGREVMWELDGRPSARPALPERDQFYCYWLSMEDLLQADQRDDRLVAELRRTLSGGYDLKALRREGPFEPRPRVGLTERNRLREAERTLREVEAQFESLRRDEAKIPSLESRIEAAHRAAARLRCLEQALDLLKVLRERREIEAGLAEYPGNMQLLRGDELRRLEVLEQKRHKLQSEIGAQIRRRDAARSRLQETGLGEHRPGRAELAARSRDLEQARRKIDQREQEQKRLEEAVMVEKQALALLGGHRDIPQLDPKSVSMAEALATRLQTTERRRQELVDKLEEAGEAPDQAIIDRHIRASEALRAWIACQGGVPDRFTGAVKVAAAGGLFAVVAAYLAGAWLALIGGFLGLSGALWALVQSRKDGAAARRRFEGSGLEPPEAWQREQVEARLQEIDARRDELQEQVIRYKKAMDIRRGLARVNQELEKLQQQKKALSQELGFDPELTAAALDRFVRLVQDYERAQRECEAARIAIKRLDTEIDALVERMRGFAGCWQAAPDADESLEALEAHLDYLARRNEQADDAERELREAEREQKRLEEDLSDLDKDEDELFRGAGLKPGQGAELADCCERLDDWREHQKLLSNVRVREAVGRKALEGEDELLKRVEADEYEVLEQDLERTRAKAEEREDLQRELTTIHARLNEAGRDSRLERAMSDVDAARMSLEERYHEALFAEAAQFLLDIVEQEYQNKHEPEVLRDARERFRRFTNHAFDLELDENKGFMARDLRQQALRSLSELSSGTRMQLLLATRLAWTRHLEQGREALPLFLDEALTTSDEHRFGRIADSLAQLARDEGRQVFYLSARRHELALWERATGTRPHHIDLIRKNFGPAAEAEDFVLPHMEALPAPDGHRPESYAILLGVPPVDPWQPEGNIHLFHLLRDDLPLLHRLMEQWRINTLGQLEGLLRSSAAAGVIGDADLCRRLEGRCAVTRAWVAAWRFGRGKPVDRIALERSGAISDTFIDRVTELAESLNGDGTTLINALRAGKVARFRSNITDELEEWLEAEGYIVPEEPLTMENRQLRTLTDAASRATPEEILQVVQWLEAGLHKQGFVKIAS